MKLLGFENVIRDASSGNAKVQKGDYLSSGKFPIIDQGQEFVGGFTNDQANLVAGEGPWIVFGDHTRALKYVDFPFCMGADGVKVLRLKDEKSADLKYVYQYLVSADIPSAGYSRHYKFLKRLDIPLPPLDEQKRIAAILDKADQLRQKRRQAIALLNSLTQSIFLEMFGDPATNPNGFPMMRVGGLAEKFSDGPFGSNLKSDHYVDQGVRVIRLQNIGVGEFIDNDRAYITEEHFKSLSKHQCLPGDVLIGTLGDPNLRACIQPDWLPQALNKADCVQLRPDCKVTLSEYCACLLNQESTMRLAQGLVLGQTRGRISMGRLRELQLPIAPLELQAKFALIVKAYERRKRSLHESLQRIDYLFASLQHRAFSGQL